MKIAFLICVTPFAAVLIAGYATCVGFMLLLIAAVCPKAGEEMLRPVNNAAAWLSL